MSNNELFYIAEHEREEPVIIVATNLVDATKKLYNKFTEDADNANVPHDDYIKRWYETEIRELFDVVR